MKIPQSPFSTCLSGSAKEVELRLRNIFQWKKKRAPVPLVVLAAMSVLLCCNLVSCQVQEAPPGEEQAPPEVPTASQPGPEDQEKADAGLSDARETEPFSFAELRNYEFNFSSGVGAWATTLMIHADGSFDGVFYDSDMGVTGDGYPSGTRYYCAFHGQFTSPVRVNTYTYSARISAIRSENEVETEEIRDGIRYIYSDAYGLQDAENILIYLPGAPLEELPEGYRSWVGYRDLSATEDTELPFYGLYNEAAECGFSGYNIVLPLKEALASAEEQADTIENSLENENLTQAELNEKAQELYELWDSLLNWQWALLKQTLDTESMRALTVEELEWIAWKEAAVAEAGAEVEGGSIYPLVTYTKAAEITRERVYVLMELFD